MATTFAPHLSRLLTILAAALLAFQAAGAEAQRPGLQQQGATATRQDQTTSQPLNFWAQQEKNNAWTVGLAAGLIEGAPLRLASEMARVVDDGENLHVLPIVTHGPTENVNSLLYLRGIDLAIINSDALEEYRVQFPEIRKHVTYLLNLFPSELHIFVRPRSRACRTSPARR